LEQLVQQEQLVHRVQLAQEQRAQLVLGQQVQLVLKLQLVQQANKGISEQLEPQAKEDQLDYMLQVLRLRELSCHLH
jgi:hypothetical protein